MFLVTSLKMSKYCEKATTENNDKGSVQTPGADATGLNDHVEDFMSLASQYRLEDMEIGESGGNEQTIEHKY